MTDHKKAGATPPERVWLTMHPCGSRRVWRSIPDIDSIPYVPESAVAEARVEEVRAWAKSIREAAKKVQEMIGTDQEGVFLIADDMEEYARRLTIRAAPVEAGASEGEKNGKN